MEKCYMIIKTIEEESLKEYFYSRTKEKAEKLKKYILETDSVGITVEIIEKELYE